MGPCVRRDDTDVIACDNRDAFAHGSERDEAIHFLCCAMDCFGEPGIGRRFAPTRWLAMTAKEELAVHDGGWSGAGDDDRERACWAV
jgi:hypothetical protein